MITRSFGAVSCSRCPGIYWRPSSSESIAYALLRFKGLEVMRGLAEGMVKQWGWTWEKLETAIQLGSSRVEQIAVACRGYCGWLTTNPTFLDEHNQLFEKWKAEVTKHAIPRIGPVVTDAASFPSGATTASDRIKAFVSEFEEFFVRWRLLGLAAPFLPEPLAPKLPVSDLTERFGDRWHLAGN